MAEYIINEDEHRAAMRKAYEAGAEACGHAEVHACANRVPARWCSCDPLRRAEAERDRYRAKAMRAMCANVRSLCRCDASCRIEAGSYCDAVIEEVDA